MLRSNPAPEPSLGGIPDGGKGDSEFGRFLEPDPHPFTVRSYEAASRFIWANNELHSFSIEDSPVEGRNHAVCLCEWRGPDRNTERFPKSLVAHYSQHIREQYKLEEQERNEYRTKLLDHIASIADSTRYLDGILKKLKLPLWLLK